MTEKLARSIGDRIGKCIDISRCEGGELVGGFMRIKVRIDITKPQWKGLRKIFPGGNTDLVEFFFMKNYPNSALDVENWAYTSGLQLCARAT
ncbi:unnamed protein product [Prunus brigantina]